MTMPRPKNVRLNEDGLIEFEVEIDGATRRAIITKEAVQHLYAANPDTLRAVRESSHITRLVGELLKRGMTEPVEINSRMLTEAGLLQP